MLHSQKLTVHKCVKEYRATAFWLTVEVTGIVVNALRTVVQPEVQTAGVQTFSVIILNKALHSFEVGAYPLIALIGASGYKYYMLARIGL